MKNCTIAHVKKSFAAEMPAPNTIRLIPIGETKSLIKIVLLNGFAPNFHKMCGTARTNNV